MMRFKDFADLVDRMAASMPDHPALLSCEGGQVQAVTWAELAARVRNRASELAACGHACEIVLADGSAACVVEVFAAVRAGLQVALVDPMLPIPVKAQLAQAVDADCMWTAGVLERIPASRGLADMGGAHRVLFFTSGTTAQSKAVVLTDESLMSSAFNGASLLPLTPDDTLLCLLPMAHVYGFVCGLLWGLACGATVALGRGMRHYADDMALFNPTAVAVVPRLLGFLAARGAFGNRLGLVLVGSADCSEELLGAVRARGIRVSLGYGLTETSSGIALSTGDDFHAMTVCPEDEVTISAEGEILVHAPTCLMQGYYRDPDKTAAAICDGILHTGDKGYLDEAGLLHVEGRLKDVVVLPNGTKAFIPEYENAAAKALGEQDIAVVALNGALTLICGRLAHGLSDAEIMAALKEPMAAYSPSSRIGRIVRLGHALPRTAAGDVERWKIQEELRNGNC